MADRFCLKGYMKPRLSRSLRRILAGMVICGQSAFAASIDWAGTETDHIWNTQTANTVWTESGTPTAFADGDDVTFAATTGTPYATVSVGENITAGNVAVDGDYTVETTAESSISGVFSGTGSLTKTGEDELTLNSTGDSDGLSLQVAEGGLTLAGSAAYDNVTLAEDATLTVAEDSDITAEGDTFSASAEGASVNVQGSLTVNETAEIRTLTNAGTGSFGTLTADTVENTGELIINERADIESLSGYGTLRVADGAAVTLSDDATVGTLASAGSVTASNALLLTEQTEQGGTVTADTLSLAGNDTFTSVTANHLILRGTPTTDAALLTSGTLTSGSAEGTDIALTQTVRGSGEYTLANVTDETTGSYTLTADTVSRYLYRGYTATLEQRGNDLLMVLDSADADYFGRHTSTANAQAGGVLLDAAFAQLDPQTDANREKYPDLAAVMDALDTYIDQGNSAAVNRVAAAVSGAAVTALGAAWRGQMERQLQAIRNRTTSLQGGLACERSFDAKAAPCTPPPYTVWANAEIDYHHLKSSGDAVGYKLNSIGGTAGFAARAGENLTLGGTFTGMSGRISSKGYGSDASGDLDAYYVGAFARYARNCWTHTFIGTVGFADTNLKRCVYFPGSSYATRGSADGTGYGLMYEVGRTMPISADYMAKAWWQPVANISYLHSSIDGFTETGSDAALQVGKQKSNNVIFGLGARMQAEVGQRYLNRSSLLEARILGKAVAGARREKARVSFPGVDRTGVVRSSQEGVASVEMGIGLTVPLGVQYGALFADCTAEFGKNYNSVNGVLGYRFDF